VAPRRESDYQSGTVGHLRSECPFASDIERVLRDHDGSEGIVATVHSLVEWREREEKRAGGNRKLLWLILLVLLPIAVTRVLDYTSARQAQPMTTSGQSVTTHTDSNGNDSYSTTNTKSTSSGVKK
jgi:hypothetical protein